MVSPELYLERAAQLRAAQRLVNETAGRRRRKGGGWDRQHGSFADWEAAVPVFWAAMRAMYPPDLWDARERLRLGDPAGAAEAINFLEADPYCPQSGYLKSDFLKYLQRVSLTDKQARRIRAVVIHVVASHWGREFRRYGHLARRVDAPAFRQELGRLAKSDNIDVAKRAEIVLEVMDAPTRNWRQRGYWSD